MILWINKASLHNKWFVFFVPENMLQLSQILTMQVTYVALHLTFASIDPSKPALKRMVFLTMYYFTSHITSSMCVDPESFVRGGPTLTFFVFFIVDEGRENPNTT